MINQSTSIAIDLSHTSEVELRNVLNQTNSQTKMLMLNILSEDSIRTDILDALSELDHVKLSDEQIETCVRRYVYDGQHDANMTYWDNIYALILDVYCDE